MKVLERLPPAFAELLRLGFGFYCVTAGIALFCNWNSQGRWAVVGTLLLGLLAVVILEALAAGFVLFIAKRLRDRSVQQD